MLEGLLILGIGAAIIVVALFGTSIMATIGAISASITAMFTGAITGTASLLTSWISWVLAADATTFYLGYIWFAGWIALFSYSAFKIATSDKKKWMNLVGRGSNYLGIALVLFLVFQPVAVSYGSAFMTDTMQTSEIDYNVTELVTQAPSLSDVLTIRLQNATTYYYDINNNTITFDNSTKEQIVASFVLPDCDSPTSGDMYTYLNASYFASNTIVKVVISWEYVGTGNITTAQFRTVTPTSKIFGISTGAISSTGSLTYIPEAFESNQLKIATQFGAWFNFGDSSNLPSDGDYISITMQFYESTTLYSQETIMLWLGASMAALDIMGLLYASGFLRKYVL